MSDEENRLCLRCILLALLPIAAAGALGWWVTQYYDARLENAQLDLAAMIEASEDLELQTTELEAELSETREQLQAARRAAASSGPVTAGEIRDRIAALGERDRASLLAALGVGNAFGAEALGEAIGAAPRTEQDRLFDRLPNFEAFTAWFDALDANDKAAWLGRLPEAQSLVVSRVELPELGLVDVDTLSRQFAILQDQADTVSAERDELRAALDGAQVEQDRLTELNQQLAEEARQANEALAAAAEAPERAEVATAFAALPAEERAAMLENARADGALTAWLEGLDDGSKSEIVTLLGGQAAAPEGSEGEDLASLRNQIDALTGDLASATAERDSLAAEIATLRGAADTPDAERLSLPGRGVMTVAEAQQAFSDLDGLVVDLRSAVEDARVSIAQSESRIAALEEEVARAQSTAEQAQADAAETRAALVGRLRERVAAVDNPQSAATGDSNFGLPVTLNANIAFATGSATLSAQGQDALNQMAEELVAELEERPGESWELVIEGHTDRRPIFTERYRSNWDLSAARAASVARYLASVGVPENRLLAVGRAQFQPIDEGESEAAYARNRRIEFYIRPQS